MLCYITCYVYVMLYNMLLLYNMLCYITLMFNKILGYVISDVMLYNIFFI